jgi:hypothetical protein
LFLNKLRKSKKQNELHGNRISLKAGAVLFATGKIGVDQLKKLWRK